MYFLHSRARHCDRSIYDEILQFFFLLYFQCIKIIFFFFLYSQFKCAFFDFVSLFFVLFLFPCFCIYFYLFTYSLFYFFLAHSVRTDTYL